MVKLSRLEIVKSAETLDLILRPPRPHVFYLAVLALLTLLTLAFPAGLLWRGVFDEGSILGFLLFILIFLFFSRLLLWNAAGREILRFTPDEVWQIVDYAWFRETEEYPRIVGVEFVLTLILENAPIPTDTTVLVEGWTRVPERGRLALWSGEDLLLESNLALGRADWEKARWEIARVLGAD